MNMNIRKRTSAHHDVDSSFQELRDSNDNINGGSGTKHTKEKKKSADSPTSDMRIAYFAIGSFVLFGIIAGYFIIQHKPRNALLMDAENGSSMRIGESSAVAAMKSLHRGPPKFVTVVLPSVVNPKGRQKRLEAIADTWGAPSRALYIVHNVSEFPTISKVITNTTHPGTVHHQPHSYPRLLLVPPSITVDQGVPRLMYVIETIHRTVNPEFAFFVNDHTFVIPEHLCKFLSSRDHSKVMYAGHALKGNENSFNSGAAGYVLSRHTMKSLVEKWHEKDAKCLGKSDGKHNKWLQGNPGLVTATCLREVLYTTAEDTRERNKWHRFHAFGLVRSITGNVDQWYLNKHKGMDTIIGTDPSYNTLVNGSDCCSEETVSFHYVEHKETRALFSVRRELLKSPTMSDDHLKILLSRLWPSSPKELGAYAHGLPAEKERKLLSSVLKLARKISLNKNQEHCFPK